MKFQSFVVLGFVIMGSVACLTTQAFSQAAEKLTPFSKYECLRFLDGETQVARSGPTGRQLMTSAQVRSAINADIGQLNARQKTLKKLRRELAVGSFNKKDLSTLSGLLNAAFLDNAVEASKLFNDGKSPKLKTKKQRIQAIDAILQDTSTALLGANLELEALAQCDSGLLPDGIPVRLVPFNEYGNHYMILVVADVLPNFKTKEGYAYLFCVKRDTVAFQLYFSKDPCSIVAGTTRYGSCPYAALDQEGKVLSGIVATSSQGSADNQDDINKLLISAYANWKRKTVEVKPASSTTDCYSLFK